MEPTTSEASTFSTDQRQRFWAKVNKTETCWLWTGALKGNGYGMVGVHRHPRYAHRVVWQMERGPIPAGLSVLHRCDVLNCVRPDHLFLGTQKENMEDAAGKKRVKYGEAHHNHSVTIEEIAEIRI